MPDSSRFVGVGGMSTHCVQFHVSDDIMAEVDA